MLLDQGPGLCGIPLVIADPLTAAGGYTPEEPWAISVPQKDTQPSRMGIGRGPQSKTQGRRRYLLNSKEKKGRLSMAGQVVVTGSLVRGKLMAAGSL